jgi:hypothetical protein
MSPQPASSLTHITWIRREAQLISRSLAENRTFLSKVFAAVDRFFEVDTASASDSA